MKSTAATVGLDALSETARTLEMLAKDEKREDIRDLHGAFVSEWARIYGELDSAYKRHCTEPVTQEKTDGAAKLPELLEALAAYMRESDIEAADETAAMIGSCSYSAEIQPLIDSLKAAVLTFDEDEAAEITAKILREIT